MKLIANKYQVKNAYYFGSYATGEQQPESDLDFLVEPIAPISILTIAQMSLDLEDALHIPVDVLTLPLPKTTHLIINKVVKCYGNS
jgi:predicted nucleotidyltransferase